MLERTAGGERHWNGLAHLSKGLLGEYNSTLIGHIVFSRLWSATLERASVPSRERKER